MSLAALVDELCELEVTFLDKADACRILGTEASGDVEDYARLSGKTQAYRHAADLIRTLKNRAKREEAAA